MDKVTGKDSSFPDPSTDDPLEAGRDFPQTTNGEVTGSNHGGIPIGNSGHNSFDDDEPYDGGDEILESEERFLHRQSLERNNNNDTASWRKYTLRLLVGLVLVSVISYVIVDFCGDREIESALEEFLEWTHAHTYEGMIVVILCYIVATVCFVPGSMLSFGAGFAIGSSVDNTAVGIFLASTVSRVLYQRPRFSCRPKEWDGGSAYLCLTMILPTGRLYRSFAWIYLFFSLGQISFSRLCSAARVFVPNLPSCRTVSKPTDREV